MECKKTENISKSCICTYSNCNRKGICCECISYHLKNRELPACCFDEASEITYNRTFEYFAALVNNKKL